MPPDDNEIIRVLVVDDEPGIRSGIIRVLDKFQIDFPYLERQVHFEVSEVDTGEAALEILHTTPPDIILLDNVLPGIQGTDLLKIISDRKLDIVVVMITSHASLDMAVNATRLGAFDFISKPFTPAELRSSMETIAKHLFLLRITRSMTREGRQIRYQFLSMLSHELKAPINAIEGYLMMIRNKEFGASVDEYQEIVDRSIQRVKGMRHLIMDLLDLTRIGSDTRPRTLENVNLSQIVALSIDTLRPYAIQKDIAIKLHAPDAIEMLADAKEIEIIFNNLISNAIKYNRDGGQVTINLSDNAGRITISVADTGIGISEEDQQKLFKEFVRLKNPKARDVNGSGLGLSIVKKIVELNGGVIQVRSEPDVGSEFLVELNKSQAQGAQ